jgi:hypothetical protein
MNHGTPEQGRQIRRRRRVVLTTFFVGGLFWFIGSEFIRRRFGQRASMAFIGIFWLFGGCSFLVFTLTYWSCPVCKHYFPRGSDGRHCRNCDTSFDV